MSSRVTRLFPDVFPKMKFKTWGVIITVLYIQKKHHSPEPNRTAEYFMGLFLWQTKILQ
jgi:hypothetical protein